MAWFQRKKSHPTPPEVSEEVAAPDTGSAAGAPAKADHEEPVRGTTAAAASHAVASYEPFVAGQGPWDIGDDAVSAVSRLDLGSLHLPAVEGMQLQAIADPQHPDTIAAVQVVVGASAMQLTVLATARSGGLWPTFVEGFLPMLEAQGYSCEILTDQGSAQILATPEEGSELLPLLVEGYQGKAWLLRVVYSGAAATDPYVREVVAPLARACLVDRGDGFYAPGNIIPLSLPQPAEAS